MTEPAGHLRTAVLVDTNVLVYPWDHREPEKGRRARDVQASLVAADRLVYSTQVIGEFYRVATCRIPDRLEPGSAASVAIAMTTARPVLPITAAVSLAALQATVRYRLSYWDAQLWATAFVHSVPVILTEDFEDGRAIAGVRFIDPFTEGFDIEGLLAELT